MAHDIKKGLGWLRDVPDTRDFYLTVPIKAINDLPPTLDVIRSNPKCPGVYDQGQIGSCVGNGTAFTVDYLLKNSDYKWPFTPSRLFAYYNARALEGTTGSDAGAQIRDGIKGIVQFGLCPETEGDGTTPAWVWPYLDNGEQVTTEPSPACYTDGVLHCALKYEAVPQDTASVRSVLFAGFPVVFGFTVHDSFMTQQMADTGIMPVPAANEGIAGGHCVVVVGWMDDHPAGSDGVTSWAICRNSWGTSWGMSGYFLMPWDQILMDPNTSSDFWAITSAGFSKPA